MPDLIPFQFHATQVSTITDIQGKPWFVAKDVCEALGVGNVSKAVGRLDDDEKDTITLSDTAGFNNTMLIINEPGLYSLVLGSRKQIAKEFKRWVTHEVLPAIRKTGSYAQTPGPSSLALAHQDMQIWQELADLFQAPRHIALQEGVKYVGTTYGLDFRPLLLASPVQDAIPEEDVMLEPTELAERLGYPSAFALNKALEGLGWQTRHRGTWETTHLGTPHSLRHAWINQGKSGYNLKWKLQAVRAALTDPGVGETSVS
jgi:prophage antirepressor-like protein